VKKFAVLSFLSVVVLCLIGCNLAVDPTPQEEPPVDTNLTKVVIPLPTNEERSISLGETKTLTNFYEAAFKRTDTGTAVYYNASASTIENQIEIDVPAGTYDILILAGNTYLSNGSIVEKHLLASAYVQNKALVTGIVNTVNMELALVDFSWTFPDNVPVGESFTGSLLVNLKNPFISLRSETSYFLVNGNQISVGSPYTFSLVSENTYKRQFNLNAPGNACTGYVYVRTAWIYPFDNNGLGYWDFGIGVYGQETLQPFYQKAITFTAPSETVSAAIQITWPTE
jgi:hypothetical protein